MEDNNNNFSVNKRILSFKYAFKGLFYVFKTQHNALIHAAAAIIAVALGFLLGISSLEWSLVALAIVLVFAAELFNTSIELLTDLISPQFNKQAGRVKDMAAAGVLVCAIGSLALGIIIFLPKIIVILS